MSMTMYKAEFVHVSGTGAQGNNAFTPGVAAAPVLPEDVEPEVKDIITAATSVIVSAACSSVHPVTTEPVINFTAPRLPVASPSIIASSIGTGKHTHDDTLADLDTMSHTSTHPSLTGRMASTTDILMTSAAWASKLTPATAVVGMQGAINRIGDILDKVVSNTTPVSPSPSSSTPVPAPAPAPPPPPVSTTLDRAVCLMETEDVDVPPADQGKLLLIFASNERTMEIYVPTCSTPFVYKGPS
ncbi:hypothetical protein BD769DRAFT_1669904 [Suillus cothurnatus]|nr:hypothetical protein BD769DRAFT_1669904 [Suillus cothurnatus]